MLRKIKVISKDRVETRQFKVRDLTHLESQIKYPHKVVRPKRGKGSYSRKLKHRSMEEWYAI